MLADLQMTTGSVGRGSGKPVEQMSTQELRSAEVSLGHAYARQPGDKATACATRASCR